MHANKVIGLSEFGAGASITQHDLPIVETGTNRTPAAQTEDAPLAMSPARPQRSHRHIPVTPWTTSPFS